MEYDAMRCEIENHLLKQCLLRRHHNDTAHCFLGPDGFDFVYGSEVVKGISPEPEMFDFHAGVGRGHITPPTTCKARECGCCSCTDCTCVIFSKQHQVGPEELAFAAQRRTVLETVSQRPDNVGTFDRKQIERERQKEIAARQRRQKTEELWWEYE